MRSFSLAQARRLAIGAQTLTGTRATSTPTRRHLRKALSHTGVFQIDSVNVLARAHYLPAYSRLGPYDPDLLDRMAFKHREMFEYWGHEAALMPVETQPLMRPRMAYWESRLTTWDRLKQVLNERPGYVEEVYQEVVDRGPVTAGEVAEDQKRGNETWGWNWTDAKMAVQNRPNSDLALYRLILLARRFRRDPWAIDFGAQSDLGGL